MAIKYVEKRVRCVKAKIRLVEVRQVLAVVPD